MRKYLIVAVLAAVSVVLLVGSIVLISRHMEPTKKFGVTYDNPAPSVPGYEFVAVDLGNGNIRGNWRKATPECRQGIGNDCWFDLKSADFGLKSGDVAKFNGVIMPDDVWNPITKVTMDGNEVQPCPNQYGGFDLCYTVKE